MLSQALPVSHAGSIVDREGFMGQCELHVMMGTPRLTSYNVRFLHLEYGIRYLLLHVSYSFSFRYFSYSKCTSLTITKPDNYKLLLLELTKLLCVSLC